MPAQVPAHRHPAAFRPRRLNASPAIVAVLAFMGAQAQAASYLETFSGPLDPAVWQLSDAGNGYTVDGGELVFTRETGGVSTLVFVPQLIGDFDVSFQYRLIDWAATYAGGDRVQLDVHNSLPASRAHAVGRSQEGGLYGGQHFGAVDNACCTFTAANTPSATLRITRSAGLVTLAVHDGNSWQTVGPQSTPDLRDMTVSFSAYIHNGFEPGTRYAIDNFTIWAEGFSQPVPEPAAGALLAAGLAVLGWTAWRRRQG